MSGEALPTVLVVGEEGPEASSLRDVLDSEDCRICLTPGGEAALTWAEGTEPDLVLANLRAPQAAVAVLAGVRRIHPEAVFIVFLAPGEAGEALRDLGRLGVYRILPRPWNPEELRLTVRLGLRCRELLRENARLRSRVEERLAGLREASA